jgi:mono/diheme cytochrome c family protein
MVRGGKDGRPLRPAALLAFGVLCALTAACGDGDGDGAGTDRRSNTASSNAGRADEGVTAAGALMRLETFPEAFDAALAERGAELFQVKGCVACHTLGAGRLVGPDLVGVTERRTPGWMAAMILEPDSMIRSDPQAKQLFAEFMTPMSDQGLSADEVRAMLEFLRRGPGGG